MALIHAIDDGDLAELRALLESGIEPTPSDALLSPLHAAITHFADGQLDCHAAAVELLLSHGADANFLDPYSEFLPMEEALAMGSVRCAELLRDAGASVAAIGPRGQTMLDYAVQGAMRKRDETILKLVLSWGVDPNVRGPLGNGERRWTALFETTSRANGGVGAAAADVLLKAGTDPCYRDENGDSALDQASRFSQDTELIELLRRAMTTCR
ncbi:MAG TPA: ankyrin repeat domain-containing protein [Gammaproteobacteria bacterium]